jgi:hypothetical protein
MPLLGIGALEHEDVRCSPTHGRVQSVQSVGAHQHHGGEPTIGESIDAADEGIDARPVLMVHLVGFTRLRQGVGLVDQQDHATACGSLGRLEFAGFGETRVRTRQRRAGSSRPRGPARAKKGSVATT